MKLIVWDEAASVDWNKLEKYLKSRSGEMANTEDLKSSEETPLVGSSPTSGTTCKCNHELYTHRGPNKECHGRDLSIPLTYRFDGPIKLINWSDPNIWCKCKKYEPKLLWCNSHQRRAERCKTEGGILLPCKVVDLTDMVEIDESQSTHSDRKDESTS